MFPASLVETAAALCTGELDLFAYINQLCDLIEAIEPQIQALLPEADRRARLLAEAQTLQGRFPDPASRPPLYGIPVGIKDIFRVEGFPTRAGSQLPAELFIGPESDCARTLRSVGARDPLATRITLIILPVGRAVVRLRLLLLASVHWRLARKRLALQYVLQPFVASLVLSQVMAVSL